MTTDRAELRRAARRAENRADILDAAERVFAAHHCEIIRCAAQEFQRAEIESDRGLPDGFDLVTDSHVAKAAHQQSMSALRRGLHPA